MRIATGLAVVVSALLLMGSKADAGSLFGGLFDKPGCPPRSTVDLFALAAELNTVYHCNPLDRISLCDQPLSGGFVRKQISEYGIKGEIKPWLLNMRNQTYSESQQDALLKKAVAVAVANTPLVGTGFVPGGQYVVYDIQFFPEAIFTANDTYNMVGAYITYAFCPARSRIEN